MPSQYDNNDENSWLLGNGNESVKTGNVDRRASSSSIRALNAALFLCSLTFLGISWYRQGNQDTHPRLLNQSVLPTTNSRYTKVQGMGFQIYTGGAPAFLQTDSPDAATKLKRNPECKGLVGYGSMWTEEGYEFQCYIGHLDPAKDVQGRLQIMKDAVEEAYAHADADPTTLKVFLAPEFYWRGIDGAYIFQEEEPEDDSVCGPVCQILMGLEAYVADKRFKDWLFLFGSITAYESVADTPDPYQSLFYNFAPVYRGYDPETSSYEGKRFIAPKRYLSTSDFITPRRQLNTSNFKELIDKYEPPVENISDTTVFNPVYTRGTYDYDVWIDYREELHRLGYSMLEYGWLMVDGLSVSIEICLDHQVRKSLTAYLADATTGRRTLIPSSSDNGLEYVPIPQYQAQIGLVASAGMTVVTDALALTNDGTIFLQDGLSNETNRLYWSDEGCELGLQFEGGMQVVQRRAFLSSTDILFEHKAPDTFQRYDLYPGNDWEQALQGSFSTKVYRPQLTVFDAMDIASVAQ